MLRSLLDETGALVRDALEGEVLRPATAALDACHMDANACFAILQGVTEASQSLEPVRALLATLAPDLPPGTAERALLLRSYLVSLPRAQDLPVAPSVKRLICEEAHRVARPPASNLPWFTAEHHWFPGFAKLATLRRFPAGQLAWEVSGLPRSWLPRVPPASLPKLLYVLGIRMRGLAPAFCIHLSPCRSSRALLLEREANKSYFRMAETLTYQPGIKGLIACSWLHSPDTLKVSPHLLSVNRVFVENGAFITTAGPARLDSGVFSRSPERKHAYEEGTFTPTKGLVVWPRAAMLAWASAHPELAES